MALLSRGAKEQRSDECLNHSSFLPLAYLPYTTPLTQLTPIAIEEPRLETHHRGTYLLFQAIKPLNRMSGILVLAENEYDEVVVLQMYQREEKDARKATDIVDMGTMLLVKEPFFKIMASGDNALRVDYLSDVVYVDKNDPMLPKGWLPRISEAAESAETSNSNGNSAMGEVKYWKAIGE